MEKFEGSKKLYKYLDILYEPTEDEFFDILYTVFSCCICRFTCTAPCWRSDDGDVICKSCQNVHYSKELQDKSGNLLLPIEHGLFPCKFGCSFTGTPEQNIQHENKCYFKKVLEEWNVSLNLEQEKCAAKEEQVRNSPRQTKLSYQRIDDNNNVLIEI